jgi:large subunit ribosomal protein L24
MKSKIPNKQRKALHQAPLHKKHKLVSAHLSKELRKQMKKRSLPLRSGDEVKVMRGKFNGTKGKVSKVDLRKSKVYIEGLKRKKVSGEEVFVPIHPSKIMITNPVMDDSKRNPKRKSVKETKKKVKQ